MSAIITDQLRILNARNFVSLASSTSSSYYTFVGLTNATDYDPQWDDSTPSPKDSFDQENDYWDTMIALKKVKADDINLVIRKIMWTTGTIYDMYRHDITRDTPALQSGATSLYSSNFYVINKDYKVYICLNNGASPENQLRGNPSLDEPTFTDLEPKSAGDSGDGYIWKYLYTIKPSEIIKFDTVNFVPVPKDWETNIEHFPVRSNAEASNNQLKTIIIKNRGSDLGPPSTIYTDIPIKGDGTGAKATIVVNNDSKVESITISSGGSGYTYASVDLVSGNFPSGSITPIFDVIIPPKGGHGSNIYRELGSQNVLIFSRIENDNENPDFITGNKIARIGIVENPQAYNSVSLLDVDKASAVSALKLAGIGYSTASFPANSTFTQTISTGTTAVGRVVSYEKTTGVLKYWQDRSLVGFNTNGSANPTPTYGFNLNRFTSTVGVGGTTQINGTGLVIDINYGTETNPGISTIINNRIYNLGQSFVRGVSNPEVKKYSGNIIYVDNRPSITRSSTQKEDIKVILQF